MQLIVDNPKQQLIKNLKLDESRRNFRSNFPLTPDLSDLVKSRKHISWISYFALLQNRLLHLQETKPKLFVLRMK